MSTIHRTKLNTAMANASYTYVKMAINTVPVVCRDSVKVDPGQKRHQYAQVRRNISIGIPLDLSMS